jgi:energy-coupling factor transporter ATP-binding protein EcfA2
MLTRLRVKNFKTLEEIDIELGPSVVFVGPNNAGKTSALQALTLWASGLAEWVARRTGGKAKQRTGVTLNRLALVNIPVFETRELWHKRRVQVGAKKNETSTQQPVLVEVTLDGETEGEKWSCGLEFQFATSETIYCRPLKSNETLPHNSTSIQQAAISAKFALLPPMSGLSSSEAEIQPGRIQTLIGEGRTAEVLRNLCLSVFRENPAAWSDISERMKSMFGVEIMSPKRDTVRGIVEMSYKDMKQETELDLSSAGRGQLQTLLLLAYLYSNPGSTLLLDEPDAHLEILRQRQIYDAISDVAKKTGSQIIAASHSEVILQEAAQRDMVISFVGKPKRIDDRGSQLLKSLKEIPFDHYYQASILKFVLYLEGSTDLEFLRAFARISGHPVRDKLDRVYVHYVGNNAQAARNHFHALKQAEADLRGLAIFDNLERQPESTPPLSIRMWKKREIENYICTKDILLRFAYDETGKEEDNLILRAEGERRVQAMISSINAIEAAAITMDVDSPWSADYKVSDKFLDRIFQKYYSSIGLSNAMRKTNFHRIANVVKPEEIDPEIIEALDEINNLLNIQ